jgi:hypothetical protein
MIHRASGKDTKASVGVNIAGHLTVAMERAYHHRSTYVDMPMRWVLGPKKEDTEKLAKWFQDIADAIRAASDDEGDE